MLHHKYLYALCVASELLNSAAGDIYRLPAFDTVQIDNLLNDEATVVITPSVDGSYYLNASMPGVSYAVNPETSTLELSQQALALDPVSGLLNLVLQPGIYQQDDSAAISTAGNVITIIVAGPLKAVLSSTSNDVVVGSNFTSDGFTTQNSGSGKLIALAMLTNFTSVSNSGSGSSYIQGDLGVVKLTSKADGGVYLGASAQYPGSIQSVDVDMSGTGNVVVATSNGSTSISGRSQNFGAVIYNQGSCNVKGPADGGSGNVCQAVTVRVPVLAQYWSLSDAAQSAALNATPAPPPPSPPPPSPPPPRPQRKEKVPGKELTNLVTTLEAIPAPAPAPRISLPGGMQAAPVLAPAPVPVAVPMPAPAVQAPDISARVSTGTIMVPIALAPALAPSPGTAPAPVPAPSPESEAAAVSPVGPSNTLHAAAPSVAQGPGTLFASSSASTGIVAPAPIPLTGSQGYLSHRDDTTIAYLRSERDGFPATMTFRGGMPPAIAPELQPLVVGTAGPSVADAGFTSSLVANGPGYSFAHEVSTKSLESNTYGG